MKIYYNISSDNYYTFKFFFQGILVVSGTKRPDNKIGNKRKSGKIEIIFINSYLHNSAGKTTKKPELNLWEEYLKSFWISEKVLIKWLDKYIKYGGYYSRFLEELKNKIKDKQL